MDLDERFRAALDAETRDDRGDPDLLPGRLVRATAAVLSVDGAGLGVHGEPHQRTPLAASDETAALVERLQFTIGRGPCLLAVESVHPMLATEERLAREWPAFHEQLVSRTPVRSMLSLPLLGSLRGLGCLSLYCTEPAGAAAVPRSGARRVAALVSEQLDRAADWSAWTSTGDSRAPQVLDTPDARSRGRLWMAVGMVMIGLRVGASDALALLRGQAYATGRLVDELADDLVERRIHPEEACGGGPTGR